MKTARKHAYTIACSSRFRDDVTHLAERRGVNVADLARSMVLTLPTAVIAATPDPGEPEPRDRETVILKSGRQEGQPWQRKPRLQVRLPAGYEIPFLRRALAMALALDRGETVLDLGDPAKRKVEATARLQAAVDALAFEPLSGGVITRDDALYVMGLPRGRRLDGRSLRARFRQLAFIHHPDAETGSHDRMSQLNMAMEILSRA